VVFWLKLRCDHYALGKQGPANFFIQVCSNPFKGFWYQQLQDTGRQHIYYHLKKQHENTNKQGTQAGKYYHLGIGHCCCCSYYYHPREVGDALFFLLT
jgi:hypothetical protein